MHFPDKLLKKGYQRRSAIYYIISKIVANASIQQNKFKHISTIPVSKFWSAMQHASCFTYHNSNHSVFISSRTPFILSLPTSNFPSINIQKYYFLKYTTFLSSHNINFLPLKQLQTASIKHNSFYIHSCYFSSPSNLFCEQSLHKPTIY